MLIEIDGNRQINNAGQAVVVRVAQAPNQFVDFTGKITASGGATHPVVVTVTDRDPLTVGTRFSSLM